MTDTRQGTEEADRRLVLGGGACVAVSAVSVALRLAGALPSGVATLVVVVVMAFGLRIFLGYAARSASSDRRRQVTRTVALGGLTVSVVTVVASLPRQLDHGGGDHLGADIAGHLWTILILLLVAGTARTLNWVVLVGLGLSGFLAVSGLAYTVGRPVINSLGRSSALAADLWVPFTEEVLKALPALLVVVLAARRRQARPSATEMALIGAVLGTGYGLYEDVQYHRGGSFDLAAMPPVSFLNPTAVGYGRFGVTLVDAGHLVWTALITLGLAIGILYRHRFARARLAIPVTFAVALTEHCTVDYAGTVLDGRGSSALFDLLRVVTLWGWLSSLLLIAGVVWIARPERRTTGEGVASPQRLSAGLWRDPAAAGRAGAALARLQLPDRIRA